MPGIHQHSVIMFCHEGGGPLELGGRHQIGPGSVVQIPGWMVHRVDFRPRTRYTALNFDAERYPEQWSFSLEAQRLQARVLHCPQWERWFERYSAEPEEILPRLARELPVAEPPKPPVLRALALAHQGATRGWGPGDIARKLDYSLAYLTSEVARHTGRSLGQWVTDARMDLAALMLREREHTVGQVAESCGYADLSHFRRAFKRRTGQPPSRFRQETSQ